MYEWREPWWDDSYQGWLCAVSEANPQKKRKVQYDIEETTSNDVSPRKGQRKGNPCDNCGKQDTLHESAPPVGKGNDNNWFPPQQWSQCNPGFVPRQWNYWRPGNTYGKGKGPNQSFGKRRCVA